MVYDKMKALICVTPKHMLFSVYMLWVVNYFLLHFMSLPRLYLSDTVCLFWGAQYLTQVL